MSPITLYTSKKEKKTKTKKLTPICYSSLSSLNFFLLFERAPFNVDTDFNQTCIY